MSRNKMFLFATLLFFSVFNCIKCSSEKKKSRVETNTPQLNQFNDVHVIDTTNQTTSTKTTKKRLVELIESKIIHDGDFNRYIYLKVKNNSKLAIIGLKLDISGITNNQFDDSDCKLIIQKKLNIPTNQTITIKEKVIEKKGLFCQYKPSLFRVGSIVLSNGRKLNSIDLIQDQSELMYDK